MAKRRVTQGQVGSNSSSEALAQRDPRWRRGAQSSTINEEVLAPPLGINRNGKLSLRSVARVSDPKTDAELMTTTKAILKALRDAGILEA